MTTTRLVEWFEREAGTWLAALELDADGFGDEPDALNAMRAAARALAGAARLAGEERVHRAAAALDAGLRAEPPQPGAANRIAEDVRLTVTDLRYLLDAHVSDEEQDARVAVVAARWAESAERIVHARTEPSGEDFDSFVVREAEGIADVMDGGIATFSDNPTNRESLGAVLRRQRALLGSARVDEIPVLAETLRAVEDLSELIVRLGVPVKSEWLDVFRCARDVLRSSAASIAEGETPAQTPALSRLRTLREELIARYGERVASQALEGSASAPGAAEREPPPDPRQRAAVLRATLAQALGDSPQSRAALDELYGLLMSALR